MTAVSAPTIPSETTRSSFFWLAVCCLFSMALGWRIRGQFGHEVGACMPGALGAMAVVLFSGREDWLRRIPFFAMLGALGWAFGGSISYMKVVGYTHSSDSATVLYGFCGMLLIGFVWSALGAAATALPAVLDNRRLSSLITALAMVLATWFVWELAVSGFGVKSAMNYELGVRVEKLSGLAQYDVDWQDATAAIIAVLILSGIRRHVDFGSSLILHLAIGWWIAFVVFVLLCGFRLNPPRGDNWAGCVGVFVGLMVFCWRQRLPAVALASILCGLIGTTGFCIGQTAKLYLWSFDVKWDWHAVMEIIHGSFFGLALAIGMRPLLPVSTSETKIAMPRWATICSIVFVAMLIPYLNIRRSPSNWFKNIEAVSSAPYGVSLIAGLSPARGFIGWFDSLWILATILLIALLIRQARRPILVVPDNSTGPGQLLYLALVWMITIMSGIYQIPNFEPGVAAIQWWITLNALICTAIVLAWAPCPVGNDQTSESTGPTWPRLLLVLSLLAAVASVYAGWTIKRGLYQDNFARGFYKDHIRFGPNNTNDIR